MDIEVPLRQTWLWCLLGLLLKKWHSMFDPRNEPLFIQKVWVMMPSLQIELWNKEILKKLGNSLEMFIELEEILERKEDKIIIKISLEFYLCECIPTKNEVERGS